MEQHRTALLLQAALIANAALVFLFRELSLTDPQFYLVPLGVSVLGLARLLRAELPARFHAPLHYAGALIILVSPLCHAALDSWLQRFLLLLWASAVVVAALCLRLRALLYTGAAFLAMGLVLMVARSSIDHPSLLWVSGIALGATLVALGALAERGREQLRQRLRAVSAALQTWS